MLKRRISGIIALMAAFWAVFILASWALAKFYMPWVKIVASGLVSSAWIDVAVWLGVAVTIASILILFRKLFHLLFWSEYSRQKAESGKDGLNQPADSS